VNRITVIAQGSHLACFVNGQPIAQHDDGELKGGSVGPAAELFHSGDHAVFEFGNFEVCARLKVGSLDLISIWLTNAAQRCGLAVNKLEFLDH
jgi:hypothetical protein